MVSARLQKLHCAQRSQNLAASFSITTVAYGVYRYSPHTLRLREQCYESLQLSGNDALTLAFMLYGIALLLYYLNSLSDQESRALLAMRTLVKIIRSPRSVLISHLSATSRLALLTVLLKSFFEFLGTVLHSL